MAEMTRVAPSTQCAEDEHEMCPDRGSTGYLCSCDCHRSSTAKWSKPPEAMYPVQDVEEPLTGQVSIRLVGGEPKPVLRCTNTQCRVETFACSYNEDSQACREGRCRARCPGCYGDGA